MVCAVLGLYTISCVYADVVSSIDWVQLSIFYLKTETESSLRNVVFPVKIDIFYYYLFTAIGFAFGGSSPTVVQTKTIKQHYTVVQHNTIKRKQHNTIKRKHKIICT
jgi:hypothetical protein